MRALVLTLSFLASLSLPVDALQGGAVAVESKISSLEGGFTSVLDPLAEFGEGVEVLGDLDGDGIRELAVGAAGNSPGSLYVLFLDPDLTVRAEVEIGDGKGGFTGTLPRGNQFGVAIESLGDRDGDGFEELAVGAPNILNTVFLLTLDVDGTVRSHVEIGPGKGGFGGTLGGSDDFGQSLAAIGDLDGDGIDDLAVGAPTTSLTAGSGEGAAWILLLNADGTVKSEQKLGPLDGGLSDPPQSDDFFGIALAHLGDLDGDGAPELAVGAYQDDEVSFDDGSVWIVSLNPDGTSRRDTKISGVAGGFTGPTEAFDNFGYALEFLGDADADGYPDLAVGSPRDDDGSDGRGAVYLLSLRPDGTVAVESKISDTAGGFEGTLKGNDQLGSALAWGGDLDADGFPDLVVGARLDDDGPDAFKDRGAIWILGLAERGTVQVENGIGINPLCLSSATPPALNSPWTGAADASVHPGAQLTLFAGRDSTLSPGFVFGAGELLVDLFTGGFVFDFFVTSFGGTDLASAFVPDDLSLLGFELHVQAAILGGGSATLCNALTLVVGA